MSFYKNAKLPLSITIALLLACGAGAYAQEGSISLRGRKMSAGEVIRSVEGQTGYRFSYNRNIYDTARMVSLPGPSVPIRELLDSMVDGAGVNYLVRGRNIAFVPSNDNPRPQVRSRTEPSRSRTSDVYVRNDPEGLSAAPVQRPAVEAEETLVKITETEPERQEEPAPEPAPEQYSDYRPIDIYGDVQTSLPRFGIRTNLLYGIAALTPNISAEAALSRRSSLALSYSNNPWKYDADLDDNRKLLHGVVGLEYRYWLCERYNGHFFGARALYSEYNISGRTVPTLFKKDYRYKGIAYGGGLLYGYALPIGRMWNLEFAAGLNVLRMDYDRYSCTTCDTNSESFKKTHLTPSAGINLVFLIR